MRFVFVLTPHSEIRDMSHFAGKEFDCLSLRSQQELHWYIVGTDQGANTKRAVTFWSSKQEIATLLLLIGDLFTSMST